MVDPNSSWVDRVVYGALAAGTALPAAVDMMGEALLNAPNAAARGGQLLARADVATDTDTKVISRLGAVNEFANAFTGLGVVGGAAPDAIAATISSAESRAAYRAALSSYEDAVASMGPPTPRLLLSEPLPHAADARYNLGVEPAKNFVYADQVMLPEGTRLYRVLDEKGSANGPWWSLTLPDSPATLRADLAVRSEWNKATSYVEYVVPEGGLPAWMGPAASQTVRDTVTDLFLPGGKTQIFVPQSRMQISPDLLRKPFPPR
jgi:hypothetical protein